MHHDQVLFLKKNCIIGKIAVLLIKRRKNDETFTQQNSVDITIDCI
jgi:hypothetical protein